MTVHALIVAIEAYPQATGLAQALPGTLKAGQDFRDWLLDKWNREGRATGETQLIFCSEPRQSFGVGATLPELTQAMREIATQADGQAEELYVFFSGHGFAFVDGAERADVLLASNYIDPDNGAFACLNLDWMMRWFGSSLGRGRHFYFIDACRNRLNGSEVTINSRLLPDPVGGESRATLYLLQSTLQNSFATVATHFPVALLKGLSGHGKAKVWEAGINDAMRVKYDSLRLYVKERMEATQPISSSVSGPEGESEGLLATLRPVPEVNLEIRINGGTAGPGEVRVLRGRSGQPDIHPVADWPQKLPLEPDMYSVTVQLQQGAVAGVNPLRMEIYDDFTHELTLGAAAPAPAPTPAGDDGFMTEAVGAPAPPPKTFDVNVEVVVPPDSSFKLRNIDTGFERVIEQTGALSLPRGRYATSLRTTNRSLVRRADVDLTGEVHRIVAGTWEGGAAMDGIARALPERHGWPDFSETLGGPVVDPDLDVWLAMLGGGRILNGLQGGDYSKIASLPLHDFSNEPAGAASLFVLAGLDPADGALDARIEGVDAAWHPVAQTAIAGVRECHLPADEGPRLISLRLDGRNTCTIATVAMPYRSTLVTVSLGPDKRWRIGQYSLPLGRQAASLPPMVISGLVTDSQPLHKLRFLAQAQRAFRRRRDLSKEFEGHDLDMLIDAKWLDPIGSALACYELIRRNQSARLPVILDNMRLYFPEMPDTVALERLHAGMIDPAPAPGLPLFQDGLRAWPDLALPYPESHLDFTSPWTAWRMAVQ
ncbi:MAG TPA: caspase family protein [Lysobacter sp.]